MYLIDQKLLLKRRCLQCRVVDLVPLLIWLGVISIGIVSVASTDLKFQLFWFTTLFAIFVIIGYFDLTVINRHSSFYIFLPLFISATQNIYLGFVATDLNEVQIKIILTTNILLAFSLFFYYFLINPHLLFSKTHSFRYILFVASLFLLFSFVSFFISGGHLVSAIASLRNLMVPFLFFCLGYLAASRVSLDDFLFYVVLLGWLIVCFGILEKFFLTDTWRILNISDLWTKKGLNIQGHGFPGNFYSSETFGGHYVRRMVSSYADPINFGTTLFLVFATAWYKKNLPLLIFSFIAIVLAVSKGAILGVIVLLLVIAFNRMSKIAAVMVAFALALIGIAFLYYAKLVGSTSVFIHIMGFWAALEELPARPFGGGLGNVGVLAGLFSEGINTKITESGMGMVIGQLGIVGLVLYILFFSRIYNILKKLDIPRLKIYVVALFGAILLNIIFNEVALSPNSAAGYFLIFGVVCFGIETKFLVPKSPNS